MGQEIKVKQEFTLTQHDPKPATTVAKMRVKGRGPRVPIPLLGVSIFNPKHTNFGVLHIKAIVVIN